MINSLVLCASIRLIFPTRSPLVSQDTSHIPGPEEIARSLKCFYKALAGEKRTIHEELTPDESFLVVAKRVEGYTDTYKRLFSFLVSNLIPRASLIQWGWKTLHPGNEVCL